MGELAGEMGLEPATISRLVLPSAVRRLMSARVRWSVRMRQTTIMCSALSVWRFPSGFRRWRYGLAAGCWMGDAPQSIEKRRRTRQ